MPLKYCPLFSGSSGNSAIIASPKTSLLIDAGMSGKAIVEAIHSVRFSPERIDGILITHEHSDHIKGAGILSRRFDLPLYASPGTWNGMEKSLGKVAPKNIRFFNPGHEFYLGDMAILPYAVSHDANEPVGFCFYHKDVQVSQMTDLGYVNDDILDLVSKSDLTMIESNHDVDLLETGPYPAYLKKRIRSRRGHLSNFECSDALLKLFEGGTHRFILGHLSGENNTEQIAYSTTHDSLKENEISVGLEKDVQLFIAHRDRPSGVFHID